MTLTKNNDQIGTGLALILEQFKDSPDFLALLTVFLKQVQDVEDVLFELKDLRFLDDAVGVQLDLLGELLGVGRGGLTDEAFRSRLRVQILINLATGTIQSILDPLEVLLPTNTFTMTETFPASLSVTAEESISEVDGDIAGETVLQTRPAGVEASFRFFEDTPEFRFDTAGNGFDQGKLGKAIGTN